MDKKCTETVLGFRDLSLSSATKTSCSGNVQDSRAKSAGIRKKTPQKCRSLESLCVGVLGEHLEDIADDIGAIVPICSAPIKATLLAIARRRGLLTDELLIALADDSWEVLDLSGSDVTDYGVTTVAGTCPRLQAVDISRCNRVTSQAVRALMSHCPAIRTLRLGGTSMSNAAARSALRYIRPKLNLNEEVGDSWEELETKTIGQGAQSLQWLVWPSIDDLSAERLKEESPRVVINPKLGAKGFQHLSVPWDALPTNVLDARFVEDIDPKTWASRTESIPKPVPRIPPADDAAPTLSIAERFRLAFVARDEKMAPKRAKNMRQNQRRSERVWLSSDSEAKSRALAGMVRKSVRNMEA